MVWNETKREPLLAEVLLRDLRQVPKAIVFAASLDELLRVLLQTVVAHVALYIHVVVSRTRVATVLLKSSHTLVTNDARGRNSRHDLRRRRATVRRPHVHRSQTVRVVRSDRVISATPPFLRAGKEVCKIFRRKGGAVSLALTFHLASPRLTASSTFSKKPSIAPGMNAMYNFPSWIVNTSPSPGGPMYVRSQGQPPASMVSQGTPYAPVEHGVNKGEGGKNTVGTRRRHKNERRWGQARGTATKRKRALATAPYPPPPPQTPTQPR